MAYSATYGRMWAISISAVFTCLLRITVNGITSLSITISAISLPHLKVLLTPTLFVLIWCMSVTIYRPIMGVTWVGQDARTRAPNKVVIYKGKPEQNVHAVLWIWIFCAHTLSVFHSNATVSPEFYRRLFKWAHRTFPGQLQMFATTQVVTNLVQTLQPAN